MTRARSIQPVPRARFDEAVEVLSEAFYDYPVMRFVIAGTLGATGGATGGAEGDSVAGVAGPAGLEYAGRLKKLVSFFTVVRFLRDDLVLSVEEDGRFVGISNINQPSETQFLDSRLATDAPWKAEPPGELEDHRLALWTDLGDAARERYEAYGEATAHFAWPQPHYHLGMIGVRRSHAGAGLGRLMLDHVHALSAAHPSSVGVSLTTENPDNVSLYEHFGYEVVGHEPVGDIETWGLFRHDAER